MNVRPAGHTAVMASRIEPPDSLDFFPTPPFATRALCEHVLPLFRTSVGHIPSQQTVWEPAAGEGHMAEPLKEYFGKVVTSDVHDYGRGYTVGSFVGNGPDRMMWPGVERAPDWIVTNPPFRLATEFVERAYHETNIGVAMLLRSVFIESEDRYEFFKKYPLTLIAPFAERVAMTKGVWNPSASTATSYAWFIWHKARSRQHLPEVFIIPPGRKLALTKPDDVRRFAPPPEDAPFFTPDPELINATAALGGE